MADHSSHLRRVEGPLYDWHDAGRFVEIHAVTTGWHVFWGHHERMGTERVVQGSRIYRDEAAVRRRMAWAIVELTGNRDEARDALALLDVRGGLPKHAPRGARRPGSRASDPSAS